jgi:hypothetical protein
MCSVCLVLYDPDVAVIRAVEVYQAGMPVSAPLLKVYFLLYGKYCVLCALCCVLYAVCCVLCAVLCLLLHHY